MSVNLERPLPAGGRLGGHFVQGHVDAMGKLISSNASGGGRVMEFSFPRDIERYLVYKGSVAVDGISLTIATLKQGSFTVAVVPHTLRGTNLSIMDVGQTVNIEADVLGKYVERFFRLGLVQNQASKVNWNLLEDDGY
jgi:riboflavin synthase